MACPPLRQRLRRPQSPADGPARAPQSQRKHKRLPQQVRVILQAMKDYGMFLADNGSPWYISGAPDERWDNDMLHLMDPLSGADFEAVDEFSLMIDPNSGQSR